MIIRIAMFASALAGLLIAGPAAALDRRMLGAWTQSASDCKTVFERQGGEIRYRKPIDEFRTAFIITSSRITTPTGRCSITSAKEDKNASTISMNCNNSIGYYDRQARLTVNGNKLTYGFPGDNSLDVTFEKCPF